MMTKNVLDLWNSHGLRIGYSHSTMTHDERMQRESNDRDHQEEAPRLRESVRG